MGAPYGGFDRRMRTDRAYLAAEESVHAITRRVIFEKHAIQGFENLIRDSRSDFIQIANAQFDLDQARVRLSELGVELERAQEKRNELSVK